MTARTIYYPFLGGLDQETAAIAIPPGRVVATSNYEAVSRGYQRTQGYERYSGRPMPSQATFFFANFTGGVTVFTVGQTVTGATSGATARVLAVPVLTSGAWNGTGVGYLPIHLVTGTFVTGENLQVAAVTKAVMNGAIEFAEGYESAANLAYQAAASDYARALITTVPGSGPIRGVVWFNGKLNAWRDNVGATFGVLHQSSAAGWVAPDLGKLLLFDGGTVALVAGNAINGATSGATAVVRYVAVDAAGDWSTGNATGSLVLDSVVGTFQDNETIRVGAAARAIVNGVIANATFPPGGRYDFEIYNFYGSVGSERLYGANGVGKAFEFDGTSIIPISTGMPDDRPFLASAHKGHLFLAFPKGSLQHSDAGEPRSFTAILGASELGLGHEITNLIPNTSTALLITTDSSLSVLTGNDSSDWVLEGVSGEAGAKAYTAQRIGQVVYLDERGIRSVAATQAYGNFKLGTFTQLIQKELDNKRRGGITAIASCVVKAKDQYLLFFDNGTGISIYFGRKQPEAMLFTYPYDVKCIDVAEVGGVERVFAGGDDGYVYELNAGTSYDGAIIEAFLQLPFGHQGAPRVIKRYHKLIVELIGAPGLALNLVCEFDYGSGRQPYSHADVFGVSGEGGLWDAMTWDTFQWDSPLVAQAESYIQGVGANMSIILFSNSASQESDTLQGISLLFSPKGQMR